MPLTVNVGLSRKSSRDFQSTGTSINIAAELDQSLLARPDELQAQVDQLYRQAEAALDRRTPTSPKAGTPPNGVLGNGNRGLDPGTQGQGGSGHTPGSDSPPAMTPSQNRAIQAIARRLGLDPAGECLQRFGWSLECLSIREASELIDHLKSLQEAGAKAGG